MPGAQLLVSSQSNKNMNSFTLKYFMFIIFKKGSSYNFIIFIYQWIEDFHNFLRELYVFVLLFLFTIRYFQVINYQLKFIISIYCGPFKKFQSLPVYRAIRNKFSFDLFFCDFSTRMYVCLIYICFQLWVIIHYLFYEYIWNRFRKRYRKLVSTIGHQITFI